MQKDSIQELLTLIPTGKSHAIPVKQLSILMGLTERQTKKTVLKARLDDTIICSGQTGYYLPENDAELLEWYKLTRSRGITSLRTLKAARKHLKAAGINPDVKDGVIDGKEEEK